MAPIRNGDGTGLAATGYSQVRKGDGTVLWNAIPDSVVYQYNAQDAFASGDDGATTTSWRDEVGSADLTGGSPIVRNDGINGNRALEYDGTDDQLGTSLTTITQPFTIISVADITDTTGSGRVHSSDDSADDRAILWYADSEEKWRIFAGDTLDGSTDATNQLFSAIYDGSTSALRENGTETVSGNAGTNDLVSINVGSEYGTDFFFGGEIGFVEVHDKKLSGSELSEREQEIADMWGITL